MDTALNKQFSGQPFQRQAAEPEPHIEWAHVKFVHNFSLQLAGSLNVRRTILRSLHLAVPYLGDWAMFVFFDGETVTLVAGDRSGTLGEQVMLNRIDPDSGLRRIKQVGRTERRTGLDRESSDALEEFIPLESLRQSAAASGPADLLALGLNTSGTTVGVLLTIRGRDRHYGDTDVLVAEHFARRVAVTLESARLYEERAHIADSLQTALRPPELPEIAGVRMAARYRPSQERMDIGGDFYDVHGDDDDFTVVIGDVCGKGVEAAVLNGMARQTIKTAAYFDRSPAAMLGALNDVLRTQSSGRFVTVACVRFRRLPDSASLVATVAVAGHPPPLVLHADGYVEEPVIRGTVAGILSGLHYTEAEFHLGPGDEVLLYTDGIDEARGRDGFFGPDRLWKLLPEYAGANPATLCEAVEQRVIEHLDGAPHDDIAVLAVRNEG